MSRRSAPTATTAAIVTGASRGIGEAVVRSLAAAGIPVAMIARDADRLREIADEILAAGGAAVFRTADVSDAEAVRSAVHDLAERLGAPIGLLVNAAGIKIPIGFFPVFFVPAEALLWGPLSGGFTAFVGSVWPAWAARSVKVVEVFSKVA